MHGLIALACLFGLYLLFPKGFKYMVGSWLGVCAGGLVWCVCAFFFHCLVSTWDMAGWSFLSFVAVGIIAGCIFAAKG